MGNSTHVFTFSLQTFDARLIILRSTQKFSTSFEFIYIPLLKTSVTFIYIFIMRT